MKDEIAILYQSETEANGGRLKCGGYKLIHDSVISKLRLGDIDFTVNLKSTQSLSTLLPMLSLFVENPRFFPGLFNVTIIIDVKRKKTEAKS